ncbi:MAG: type II toxin-antitoxin system PrlF family antitoxin [Chloroflexota bacterium]|nr:type II toxin-antitoxin system PrlF family antitoxin [Chloroflexota bacterium]
MLESEVTAKGQTTLPEAVREALGVGPGDRVRYFVVDGEVRIRAVRPIQRLFGMLAHDGPPVTLDDMQQAIVDGATDR